MRERRIRHPQHRLDTVKPAPELTMQPEPSFEFNPTPDDTVIHEIQTTDPTTSLTDEVPMDDVDDVEE